MPGVDTIASSVMPDQEGVKAAENGRNEVGDQSPKSRFEAARDRVKAARDKIGEQFGKLRSKAPDNVLKPEVDALAGLFDDMDVAEKKAATVIGLDMEGAEEVGEAGEGISEGGKPNLDVSENEPLKPEDMALVRAVKDKLGDIDDWVERTGDSAYAVSPYGVSGIEVASPLRIAYGLYITQNEDGSWVSRETSFRSSIEICEAMAEFMGNGAHVARPITLNDETKADSLLPDILNGKTWLKTQKEGDWPVAMMKEYTRDEGGNLVAGEKPSSHDAYEIHRAVTMFMPGSSQELISQVAELEEKRREDGRPLTILDDDKDPPFAGPLKNHMNELGADGMAVLDDVTDDGSWLSVFDRLVNAPRGTLDQRFHEVRDYLDIGNSSAKLLSLSPFLNGHLNLKNYVSRETQQKNLTEDEIRVEADRYLTELNEHILKIRGTN